MNGHRLWARGQWLCILRGAACVGLIATLPAGAGATGQETKKSDDLTLEGGAAGTVFKSLTVEGENRIRIDIARPRLQLDLDPRSAPGLDPGTIAAALDRDRPGLLGPLHAEIAQRHSPYTARPWLDGFATGPVARFRPDVSEVDRWRLVVADSRGREVATFEGKGKPRKDIVWDGRAADGSVALPGLAGFPGELLVMRGRVWGHDTKKPIANALLDIWQADAEGSYDLADPRNPPPRREFRNRIRLMTDENGYYEYETIRPGHYTIGLNRWRPSHIHYMVQATGYKSLVTQLYFEGDKHNAADAFIKKSLIIAPQKVAVARGTYETGTFDTLENALDHLQA